MSRIWKPPATAEQVRDDAPLEKSPARDNSEWLATVAAREEECPGNGELQLVAPEKLHWKNSSGSGALRRDRYCCRTPGCPNHLYLETHPIVSGAHWSEITTRTVV